MRKTTQSQWESVCFRFGWSVYLGVNTKFRHQPRGTLNLSKTLSLIGTSPVSGTWYEVRKHVDMLSLDTC